jgi:hypothetical protein
MIAVILFGLPVTIFGGMYLVYRRANADEEDELRELRNGVASLRRQIEERDDQRASESGDGRNDGTTHNDRDDD